MKKIIVSIVALMAIATTVVTAQAPHIKEAIKIAVDEVAKKNSYSEEQVVKIVELINAKEAQITKIYKEKLPTEQRTEKIKASNNECADKINEVLGAKNAHKEFFTATTKYVREAKEKMKK